MPSGVKIDWAKYDSFIISELPKMTIVEWGKQYAPGISAKAIGTRARKLQIKPATYKPTDLHKNKIANRLHKETPEIVDFVKSNIDDYSRKELASLINLSPARLNDLINRHNIKLSKKGRQRAREASRKGSLGKTPWNKGIKLPEEMKIKMAIGRQKMSGRLSKLQATFYKILDENNIHYFKEESEKCRFGPWVFDCRIDHNGVDILVEVQGDYIHSLPKNISKDRAKSTYMERYFPNVPVKYIWEHEFGAVNRVKQVVRQWLNLDEIQQEEFDFSNVHFEEINNDVASKFLSAFHYLGKLAGRYRYGAFINDKLIAASIWAAPTRVETATRLGCNNLDCLELRRFVIHDAYHKKNFGSYCLSRMEKLLPSSVTTLVSFADSGVGHDGALYKATNWKMDGYTQPSYFYVDSDGYVMLKKTLYNNANKMHMKESEFAETYNYSKIIQPRKTRFIKVRS